MVHLERNMSVNSSLKTGRQVLGIISPSQAENLLSDWANMPGPWPLEAMSKESALKLRDAAMRLRRRYKPILGDSSAFGHLWLRNMLRRTWDSSDIREAEWFLFRFRDSYAAMVRRQAMTAQDREKEDFTTDVKGPRYALPPATAIEAAAFHLQRNLHRALHCPNLECPAPYFFAKKKGQKFCSSACAQPAQRESKRKWWHENRGKKRRK